MPETWNDIINHAKEGYHVSGDKDDITWFVHSLFLLTLIHPALA
jgi:hypothetical protein